MLLSLHVYAEGPDYPSSRIVEAQLSEGPLYMYMFVTVHKQIGHTVLERLPQL